MDKFWDANGNFASSIKPDHTPQEVQRLAVPLIAALKKTPLSGLLSGKAGTESDVDILDLLNPEIHSLSYLFVLGVRLDQAGRSIFDKYYAKIVSFYSTFDPRQIVLEPEQFKRLSLAFVQTLTEVGKPLLAVKPLKNAILRMDTIHPGTLTYLHTPFIQTCLLAKTYRDALPVLALDTIDIPVSTTTSGFSVQECQQYFLYGGMVYIGMKRWKDALNMLDYVLITPGTGFSQIQVEAYKKYILVCLLYKGKPLSSPKLISKNTARGLPSLVKPYELFIHLCSTGAEATLQKELDNLMTMFQQDNNVGLAMQCLLAFKKLKILNLTNTYVTLTTADILQKTGGLEIEKSTPFGKAPDTQDIELSILNMIEEGSIHGTISQSPNENSLITFLDPPHLDQAGETEYLLKITEQIQKVVTLNHQTQALNRKLGLEREYISHLNKVRSHPTQGMHSRIGESVGSFSFTEAMDEDLDDDEAVFS
ncbi:hypothetical protein BJ508DRAFT_415807 [Ascobolus immersus RN42]|uniref:COP9 signalosome complex subunit 3 N-terminal helical repeats domain-containing protein n=1 Tax=Ascobolus immersus RN42 TaxID=1160509 RepID=A0A3N4I0L1_ASCIM|nr:hypothetical protein BJ508DRAFT_415807 [Ascobolus immersus RN42]